MRKKRYRLNPFIFFDRTGIEARLEKMARKGWMLEQATPLFVYRKTEPADVQFAVCYTPKISELDPDPLEEEQDFRDFCAHTGWEYVCASAQMQFFRNFQKDPVPIETDPLLEVASIHLAAQKRYLRYCFFLLVLFLFRLANQLRSPIQYLISPAGTLTITCSLLVTICSALQLLLYGYWRHQALLAAERGEFLNTTPYCRPLRILNAAGLVLALLAICARLLDAQDASRALLMLVLLLGTLALLALCYAVLHLCRTRGASRTFTRNATYIPLIVGLLFLWGSLPSYWPRSTPVAPSAAPPVSAASLLLTLEDLDMAEDIPYTYAEERNGSLFLEQLEQSQRSYRSLSDPVSSLSYTITQVQLPFLYGACREELLHKFENWRSGESLYAPIDHTPWKAREAYCTTGAGEDGQISTYWYLLCYGDRFVELKLNWQPDAGQMARIADALAR